MANVVVEFTPEEAKLFRAQQKLNSQIAEMERGYTKTGNAGQRAGDRMSRSAKRAAADQKMLIGQFTQIVSGYASVQGAIMLVNSALQEKRRLEQESLTVQEGLAAAQQGALINFGTMPTDESRKILTEILPKMQRDARFPSLIPMTEAMGAAVSAADGDIKAAKEAVETAAKLTRFTPDDLSDVASKGLDIRKAVGSDVVSAKEAVGFMVKAGEGSRIESPAKLAKTLAQAVGTTVTRFPQTDPKVVAQETAAILGQITLFSKDTEGEPSGTILADMMGRLDEFFDKAERRITVKGEDGQERQLTIPADPGTPLKQMEIIANNRAFWDEFWGEGFGKAKQRKAVEELFNVEADIFKRVREVAPTVKFDAGLADKKIDQLTNATAALSNATTAAGAKGIAEARLLASEGGRIAAANTSTAKVIESSRRDMTAFIPDRPIELAAELGVLGGETPEERQIKLLERQQKELGESLPALVRFGYMPTLMQEMLRRGRNLVTGRKESVTREQLTPARQESFDALQAQIDNLRQANLRALERMQERPPTPTDQREQTPPPVVVPVPQVNVAAPSLPEPVTQLVAPKPETKPRPSPAREYAKHAAKTSTTGNPMLAPLTMPFLKLIGGQQKDAAPQPKKAPEPPTPQVRIEVPPVQVPDAAVDVRTEQRPTVIDESSEEFRKWDAKFRGEVLDRQMGIRQPLPIQIPQERPKVETQTIEREVERPKIMAEAPEYPTHPSNQQARFSPEPPRRDLANETLLRAATSLERAAAALATNTGLQQHVPARPLSRPSFSNDQRAQAAVPA